MKLHISPCPNDTFVFHAMIHSLVDTEGLTFETTFEDIDCLNHRAQRGDGDIIKISYATLPMVTEHYRLLNSGGALGFGNAPIIVGKSPDIDLTNCTIAIPGEQTTAALLLRRLVNPDSSRLRRYLFSDIAAAVASGEVDAGVLIHEGRFTYASRGLHLVADLGELWAERYDLPVPLGAIVVNRDVEEYEKIDRIIRRSVEYAMAHPEASADFVRSHAQELADDVRQKHISYFVNRYTVDLGEQGRRAVELLLENNATELKIKN